MKKTLVTLAFLVAFGAVAIAKPPAKGSNLQRHLAKQEMHIKKEVAKGKITPAEASQLQTSGAKIQIDVNAAQSDGKVTKAEREQIKQELKARSQEIKALKHN